MSDRNLPRARDAHSLASAEIGARLNLKRRRGAENAKLLWFVILSHTPWGTLTRPTWACDETLANEAGVGLRDEKRALAVLREAGMLTTPTGHRPGAQRPYGRLLVPRLGSPAKVLIPDVGLMTNLWITCRERRARPGALVTLAVGCYVLAAHELDRHPRAWSKIPGKLADVRRFVGARKNAAWTERVRDLERLGLLARDDGQLWLAPTSRWMQCNRLRPPAPMRIVPSDIPGFEFAAA